MSYRLCLMVVCLSMLLADSLWAQEKDSFESTDRWLGGIGSLKDDHFAWRSVSAEFDVSDSESWRGKLKRGDSRQFRMQVERLDENQVEMTLSRRRAKRQFVGALVDGVLSVKATDGQAPDQIVLRRIHTMSPIKLSELAGVYEISPGHSVAINSGSKILVMTDFKTGIVRRLYPVADDRFVAGEAIGIPAPVEFEVDFSKGQKATDFNVAIRRVEDGQLTVAKRLPRAVAEEFSFESFDSTIISGTLHKPSSSSDPCPAIVWVHGSGRVTRDGAGSWPLYFTRLGFAVLSVDKRGMGASGGKYNMPDGGFDNFAHMQRRSKDVAAAVNALAGRKDILANRIGLLGASQAGWVIPSTVDQCQPAFAITLYGGATPVSVEGQYSRLASENSSGALLRPVAELIQELRKYKPTDPGIDSELSRMDYPSLWLYGARDRSNPSQLCAELIKRISNENKRDFTVTMFPNGNHGLMECRFGGGAEYFALQRCVPDLYRNIETWLEEKKQLPKQ